MFILLRFEHVFTVYVYKDKLKHIILDNVNRHSAVAEELELKSSPLWAPSRLWAYLLSWALLCGPFRPMRGLSLSYGAISPP